MTLSRRMEANAALVAPCRCLADVGCDHAYLPIVLVHDKRAEGAIAMDIRSGPLERAREHICRAEEAGYIPAGSVEVRLSDGLDACRIGEADAILIAGMGGRLMQTILRRGEALSRSAGQIILQPQSEIEALRRFLVESGYIFLAEDMVIEDGKYYTMMKVRYQPSSEGVGSWTGGEHDSWTKAEYRYGRLLLEARHPVLHAYLQQRISALTALLEEIPVQKIQRREQIASELDCARSALKTWGMKEL